ncbi:MAG TPA: 4-hydroxy-tetrahydrodipicolinate synthase [Acidimicrobiia bacterium]|nr:4-hydroxy-tetrahydrodipicolinate synthase [Acidimicrobiia bacterium]
MSPSPSAPFGHVATAMITPFTAAGQVDHEKAWALARYLSDNGSDALVVTGTTGESPTLSTTEKLALYKTVVDAVAEKDTFVIAGTGNYNTAESVELTEKAADLGCDGALAVTPYYNKPSQAGLVAHFSAIADVGLPVMLYNIPSRTGRLIELETLARLAEHQSIVAVKDAVESVDFTGRTVNLIPGFPVYSGQDSHTWPMIAVGAIGVVSVIAHLAGRVVASMVKAGLAGDVEEARRLHHMLLPLCEACFLETNPAPVKGAMDRLWEPVGDVRLPLVHASEETLVAIEKALGAVQGL